MKKKMVIRLLSLIMAVIIFVIIFIKTEDLVFSLLISLYFFIMLFLIANFKKNALFIFFLISFGTFLLLKPIALELLDFSNEYRIRLLSSEKKVTYICLFISLVSLIIGYSFKIKYNNTIINTNKIEQKIKAYKPVSLFFTIICLGASILNSFIRWRFIRNIGYTSSFLSNNSFKLQEPFYTLIMIAPLAYSLFFATKPSKKECLLPFSMLLVDGILNILTGNRFEIISIVFFIFIYQALRDELDDSGKEKWLNTKKLMTLVVLIPIIINLLQSLIYWREGNKVNIHENIYVDFFYSIGGSSDLIGFSYRYKDILINKPYSFGRTYRNLNDNIIAKIIGISKSYTSSTIEKALYGHDLSDTLTYKLYPKKFLAGYGMGDCYIADLFIDFSYIGVIIGNVFLGLIMKWISTVKKNNFLSLFIGIFLIISILRMPRDTFDYFISQFVGLKNLLPCFLW